jgi:hypothetical protein
MNTAIPPSPFPRKGATEVPKQCLLEIGDLSSPRGGPAETTT